MAKEVRQACKEVLTIVNTSWEPTDRWGMRERLGAGVRFRTSSSDRDSLEHEPYWPGWPPRRPPGVRGPGWVDRADTLYLLVDGTWCSST